jgi:hypothetical protein
VCPRAGLDGFRREKALVHAGDTKLGPSAIAAYNTNHAIPAAVLKETRLYLKISSYVN